MWLQHSLKKKKKCKSFFPHWKGKLSNASCWDVSATIWLWTRNHPSLSGALDFWFFHPSLLSLYPSGFRWLSAFPNHVKRLGKKGMAKSCAKSSSFRMLIITLIAHFHHSPSVSSFIRYNKHQILIYFVSLPEITLYLDLCKQPWWAQGPEMGHHWFRWLRGPWLSCCDHFRIQLKQVFLCKLGSLLNLETAYYAFPDAKQETKWKLFTFFVSFFPTPIFLPLLK